jgi:hypothetical protein
MASMCVMPDMVSIPLVVRQCQCWLTLIRAPKRKIDTDAYEQKKPQGEVTLAGTMAAVFPFLLTTPRLRQREGWHSASGTNYALTSKARRLQKAFLRGIKRIVMLSEKIEKIEKRYCNVLAKRGANFSSVARALASLSRQTAAFSPTIMSWARLTR